MLAFEIPVDVMHDHGEQMTDIHAHEVFFNITCRLVAEREDPIDPSLVTVRRPGDPPTRLPSNDQSCLTIMISA